MGEGGGGVPRGSRSKALGDNWGSRLAQEPQTWKSESGAGRSQRPVTSPVPVSTRQVEPTRACVIQLISSIISARGAARCNARCTKCNRAPTPQMRLPSVSARRGSRPLLHPLLSLREGILRKCSLRDGEECAG